MAVTTYGTNDTLTNKVWSKMLAVEALKATAIAPLIGTSSSSIIHRKTELEKGAGDKITFGLRMQLSGKGVGSTGTLEGNEEALTTYADSLVIDELAHAVRVRNPQYSIDAKRVNFEMRSEAKDGLVDWYAKRLSVSFFNQVCGYTPANTDSATTGLLYTGNNAVVAPSAGYQIWSEAGAANDEALDNSGDLMTLKLIDYAKEKAQTAAVPIRPLKIGGEDKYVIYLHPYQVTDLRTDAATAGSWYDIQKAAIQGGKISDNPIYSGALGEYNGVIIRQAFDVTQGVNSGTGAAISTVRRAVFLGAQAASVAFAGGGGPDSFRWEEEEFDYGRELGVSAQTIVGMKKNQFNSTDFGTIVVSTYAVAHS